MEIKQRMSKRFLWLLGAVVVIAIGFLVACSSSYNQSSDGLVLVGSQGSALIETFSFNPFNGHVSAISNTPTDTSTETCVLSGVPTSIVINPAGSFAYTIITANTSCPSSTTGILTLKINSDGSTTAVGNPMGFRADVVPNTMVMDSAGKFLFVANRANSTNAGSVSVFAIGTGGGVTEVAGSPFYPPVTAPQPGPDIVSVAATPTVFPAIGVNGVQNSVCSAPGISAPTTQYLYAVDDLGNQVFQFQVNTSSGVLTNPPNHTQLPFFPTDQTPAGVAVDPCNRFVYVSDSLTNKVSAYTICNGSNTQSQTCPQTPDGSLVQVSGSPFSLSGSNSPGPLVVDPYGNNVYVLGTLSNTVSALRISPISGSLTALTQPTAATGSQPKAMAIRGDDNWLFVTNFNPPTVSQYSITPATGALSVLPTIDTDNYPFGVAVR